MAVSDHDENLLADFEKEPEGTACGGEPDQDSAPLESVLRTEEREQLWDAVQGLEIRQRTAVVLYYYNQMSTKEIAKAMGCLEGTVKSRLHTARKNLKDRLNAREKEGLYEKRTV